MGSRKAEGISEKKENQGQALGRLVQYRGGLRDRRASTNATWLNGYIKKRLGLGWYRGKRGKSRRGKEGSLKIGGVEGGKRESRQSTNHPCVSLSPALPLKSLFLSTL